jgi:pimeloyl-ACP methyl ester carboxylesterase
VLTHTAALLRTLGERPVVTDALLRTIGRPVRVLVGDRDATVTLEECVAAYRALPDGALGVLPRTPHPLEQVDLRRLAQEIVAA